MGERIHCQERVMPKSNPVIQCCAGSVRILFAIWLTVLYLKTDRLGLAVIAAGLFVAEAIYHGYLPETWRNES